MTLHHNLCLWCHQYNFIAWLKLYCRFGDVTKVWWLKRLLWEKLPWPQFYKNVTRKTTFFKGWSWFKFNNLGLALGMALKFYTSLAKGLKLKSESFWADSYVFRSYREKLVGRAFLPPSSWIELTYYNNKAYLTKKRRS